MSIFLLFDAKMETQEEMSRYFWPASTNCLPVFQLYSFHTFCPGNWKREAGEWEREEPASVVHMRQAE
jgi:hypothetical protein